MTKFNLSISRFGDHSKAESSKMCRCVMVIPVALQEDDPNVRCRIFANMGRRAEMAKRVGEKQLGISTP
jgi:hypothetical protein